MDFTWLWIPISLFLLIGGYFLRRRSSEGIEGYLPMALAVDFMCAAIYAGAFLQAPDLFHVIVFVLLLAALAGGTVFVRQLEGRRKSGGNR